MWALKFRLTVLVVSVVHGAHLIAGEKLKKGETVYLRRYTLEDRQCFIEMCGVCGIYISFHVAHMFWWIYLLLIHYG